MPSTAVQQFLLLAKSVRGVAAVDLVTRILEHPDIFGFEEFLRLDSLVEALKRDHPLVLSTLELFAYGTITDYESQHARFVKLTPLARRKLQLLTLASLAVHTRILSYQLLLQQLQIDSIRELEDLIIDGIYAQVIRGKLDQRNSHLDVEFAIARDVDSTALNRVENILDKWCTNCSALLNVLKHEAKVADGKKKQFIDEQDKYDKEMLSMIKIANIQGQLSGGGSKRDNYDNENNLTSLHNVANVMTDNSDSKQSRTKKSIRNIAKRVLRP